MENKGSSFTIPNILTLFRLALIPIFILLYRNNDAAAVGCVVLMISGLTDILDGYIARHWNMESELGKILDPVADKLTQAAALFCLAEKFTLMLIPLSILFIKEMSGAALCCMAIRKSGHIQSSRWHGKLNTVLLYGVLVLHLIWVDMPQAVSVGLVTGCSASMLFSALMYAVGNIAVLRKRKNLT